MRHTMLRILLLVVMVVSLLGLFVSMAKADGGGSPFIPGDQRINPWTGDKLAVYLHNDRVDVWGIDPSLRGFRLTTFTVAEMISGKVITHDTAYGTVTLRMLSQAKWHVAWKDEAHTAQTIVVDKGAVYTVSWVGAFGADGADEFLKVFSATYALPPQ